MHTPNTAIIHTFGTLYTKLRIDQKQLLYLHRILTRDTSHWTRKTLTILKETNIGWYANIHNILTEYKLPTEFAEIKNTTHNTWKYKVHKEIEKKNKIRLSEECHDIIDEGITKEKTKTASIIRKLAEAEYKRQIQPEILKTTKHEAKTILIARYGMLQCGKNYKGTLSELCNQCKSVDDEDHRLNYCIKWRNTNYYDVTEKINFDLIYSADIEVLRYVIMKIEKVWNTRNAHGAMNVG